MQPYYAHICIIFKKNYYQVVQIKFTSDKRTIITRQIYRLFHEQKAFLGQNVNKIHKIYCSLRFHAHTVDNKISKTLYYERKNDYSHWVM